MYNPNFLAASIQGDLHVLFYRTVAGCGRITPLRLPPRASPKVGAPPLPDGGRARPLPPARA